MDADYKTIKWEMEDGIGILWFNRPDSLNALSLEMRYELLDILPRIAQEKDLSVLIVTGEGKAFCAGGDMDKFLTVSRAHQERGGAHDLFINDVPRAFLAVEVPIIAAVNGPAVGGGFTISLTCDLRIASDSARFGAVFVRVGLAPEYGSSFLLTRIVGLTRASELIMTARIFDAQESLSMGLVSEVVEGDQLLNRARELAKLIASHPPMAIRMAKRVLRHGLDSTLSQAMEYEELAETHCFSSLDHQEAVLAFMEKRPPIFQGR
jgi:2-(1,2-epoxy-1,2-dihydrophenyl)acetyl-CoA isomerase